MQILDKTAWEILNATADDWENLEQIFLSVCFEVMTIETEQPGHAEHCLRRVRETVLLAEIADRVRNLVVRGLLTAIDENEGRPIANPADLTFVWKAWFRMTPEGKRLWEAADYADLGKPN